MKKSLTLFTFIFLQLSVYAQNIIEFTLVNNDSIPIPYANIFFENKTMGTISNEDGHVKISIPKNITKNDNKLIVSVLGYELKKLSVHEVLNMDFVRLESKNILLDEVIIKPGLSAEKIVNKAFDLYNKNFPESAFVAEGFLRHTEKNKLEYKWLIEAAIQMYDPGYDKDIEHIKTNIVKIKKSYDNRNIDTLDFYRNYLSNVKGMSFKKSQKKVIDIQKVSIDEIEKAIIYNDNKSGNPEYVLSSGINPIRYYNQKNAFLDKNLLKKHSFKIDTIITSDIDNADICKIKITPKNPPAKLNKHFGKYLLPYGWIYINANDYSIVEFEYILIHDNKVRVFSKIGGSKVHSKFTVKLMKINGKMYPKYISYEKPKIFFRMGAIMDSMVSKKEINKENQYFLKQEILFTNIITNSNLIKVDTDWNSNIFTPRPYDKEFWDNYNILLESKEEKKMINDLEKKISLKEQFEHQ